MNCHRTASLQPEALPPETVSWARSLAISLARACSSPCSDGVFMSDKGRISQIDTNNRVLPFFVDASHVSWEAFLDPREYTSFVPYSAWNLARIFQHRKTEVKKSGEQVNMNKESLTPMFWFDMSFDVQLHLIFETTFVCAFLKLQQLLQQKVTCLSTAVLQKAKEKTWDNDTCQPDDHGPNLMKINSGGWNFESSLSKFF